MKNKNLEIFLDLDGTVVDFDKQIFKHTGKHAKELDKDKKTFYKILAEAPIEFWSTMEWLPNGKTLYNHLTNNYENIKILSTPAEPWKKTYNKSIIGKNIWIKRELGLADDKIILSDRKEQFVNPKNPKNSVLIDDRIKNIDKWNGVGGTGILYTSAWNTIEKLKLL